MRDGTVDTNSDYVGHSVGRLFRGIITSFDMRKELYLVKYEGGFTEELTFDKLTEVKLLLFSHNTIIVFVIIVHVCCLA